MKEKITLLWFRRDLRLEDNAALYHALKAHDNVLPLFIFDQNILDDLEDTSDARVSFIYETLKNLEDALHHYGSSLMIKCGDPVVVWRQLFDTYSVEAIYANHDYEPYAIKRDHEIYALAKAKNTPFKTFKDQVIFEKNEVLKDDGTPYTIFTPYSKKWKEKFTEFYCDPYPVEKYLGNFFKTQPLPFPTLKEIGFSLSTIKFPPLFIDTSLINTYHETRDLPGIYGTSRLGIHLRFGTLSIRKLVRLARELNEKYFNELIWREFYQMILWHFPNVVHQSFKPKYDAIQWRNHEREFELWRIGQTGYPIVDAGMRELMQSGYMHNRVRMITASFLTKHLLIDWRWGESWFAKKLLDYELASNNGGWQWAAGTGVDAAPYFRIFNPYEQTRKFDPELKYIRQWVPEYDDLTYVPPMVDHAFARKRALQVYKEALQ